MNSDQIEIAINGMEHVILKVSQFTKARSIYKELLVKFGMPCMHYGTVFCYHVVARTALGIIKCDPKFKKEKFEQYRIGLHHLCSRARSHEDVDKTAPLVISLGQKVVRGPEEHDWAASYYHVRFEDPDAIRPEVNFFPGLGLLKKERSFGSGDEYVRVEGRDLNK